MGCIRVAAVWMAVLPLLTTVSAQDESSPRPLKPAVDADGTIHAPAFAIPFSSLASEQSKRVFMDRIVRPLPSSPGDIEKTRRDIEEQFHTPLLKELNRLFPVNVTREVIGGVQTDVVVPKNGISKKNRSRVLINLHGGGFQVAAQSGGQVESIPIAGLGRIKVITPDYRQGPEHKFPAASEDVATVYQELLKQYQPKNIGIYGCSAGGMLTAEALAWFQTHRLPSPGAAGIFGAGAVAAQVGDSGYIGNLLSGEAPTPLPASILSAYFGNRDMKDPLVSPVYAPSILAQFPPTLVLAGSRDPLLSGALYTHSQLVKAGAEADLHVWEGMRHCFFFWPDPPESHEAWSVIVRFFDRHLGT